ncbi:hypothetical protein CHGG_10716 [Chaetomium globosum CBS 148.51]|uniref:Fe2OG dioxygenase domain-containing protein n=1 Tax=Chaetomium globosum (strain ATCC 6205 / CBS 148.51 / DSM 1962 / NBRC 6347 / NRRL 1970) TaxID=306901 RepID=Q2GMT8_CHAGB|nr:uncharacterized protein CHGG_10716 [Chaetomium globosum CBS 148.51]EAQ84312.1 hypothetical protein CHGG_10716 [Chaetomium globosum CBS 148.51]
MTIPVIDAAALTGGDEQQLAVFRAKLLDGLKTYGFVKLINHTVPVPLVAETFDQRGWCTPGEEKTWYLESNTGAIKEPKFSDSKESFDCGHPNDKLFPNKWPSAEALPGYQDTMERFFMSCGDLTLVLLTLIAEEMQYNRDLFTSRCTNEASTIRINHFPVVDKAVLDRGDVSRIWPHNDFGIISLVFPDVTPGLEYEDRANPGTFIPMPYESDQEVVVIVGETLQRWTNGGIRAGLHRVNRPLDVQGDLVPERWSLVYFNKADRHASVGPLDEMLANGAKPVYEHLTALEYQGLRNATHYPKEAALEQVIATA